MRVCLCVCIQHISTELGSPRAEDGKSWWGRREKQRSKKEQEQRHGVLQAGLGALSFHLPHGDEPEVPRISLLSSLPLVPLYVRP